MKLDFLASASAGWFTMTGAVLVHIGTSWPVLIMALIGAVFAVWELEARTPSVVARMVAFNGLVGALGAPVVAAKLELGHPAALALFALFAGWAGHDIFVFVRTLLKVGFAKRYGAGK